MLWLLLYTLLSLPSMLTLAHDPAPGLTVSIEDSRRLVCERASVEAARRAHPGLWEDAYPRGDYIDRDAVLCAQLMFAEGERDPLDRAVLAEMETTTSGLARRLAAERERAEPKTWLVEVHYPSAAVGSKLTFATKNALIAEGFTVTDRLPVLAAGDIQVLSQLPPLEAYPVACKRYFAKGRLTERDAVLSLLVLDSRETILHAGTCVEGEWTWVQ